MFMTALRSVFLASSVAITGMIGVASAGTTDFGELWIVDPVAYEAQPGTDTKLEIGFINEGLSEIHVVRVTSPVARGAQFRLEGVERASVIQAISVPADDSLSLEEPTVWVELKGLHRGLRAGERIPITLHLANGALVTVEAEVAPSPAEQLAPALGG